MPKELTPKRKRFCEEWVIDHNGTQAATRAKYSPKTANEQAARMLADVSVKMYIAHLEAKTAKKTGETVERVVLDIRAVVTQAIGEGDKCNALKGLDMLAKHVGAFEADNRQQQAFTLIIERPGDAQPIIEAEVIETCALPAGMVGVPIPGPVNVLAAVDLPAIERAS